MSTTLNLDLDSLYPSSDGKPMAENTVQYRWIVLIKENLELILASSPDVFIAADLLWYPVQVDMPPAPRQAPDVMVVFGRPRGDRRSYKQWEEANIPPQVVFEILSESNRTVRGRRGLQEELEFYETHGVEEYYIYDPDVQVLEGWQRHTNQPQDPYDEQPPSQLRPILPIAHWVSPRLGIQFDWQMGRELVLRSPTGEPFLGFAELKAQAQLEQQRAEQERRRANQERQRADELAAYLRSLGVDPDHLPAS
jgi:Uma2 family endonuclease